MKPDYLLLRGFEGILSGMGLSEIEIDFSVVPDGIVVFDGPNGRGKTTLVDNMHHFRVMPSKVNKSYSPEAFSFYEETYGCDACKIFVSTMRGMRHKSVVSIDAVKRKQKCYLYEEVNGNWKPLNPDGSTESYDKAVEAIFGTPQLYFISNFRDQRAKSFSRYSKGDIKEILAELLGIDGIKELSDKAGRIRKALQDHLTHLRAQRRICCASYPARTRRPQRRAASSRTSSDWLRTFDPSNPSARMRNGSFPKRARRSRSRKSDRRRRRRPLPT